MAADERRMALLGLAAVFHDPPWKPWGIKYDRVRGDGGSVPEKILNALGAKAESGGVAQKVYEGARRAWGQVSDHVESHEAQAILLAGALYGALEAHASCGELSSLVWDTVLTLSRKRDGWELVRRADVMASALDRAFLFYVERATKDGGGRLEERKILVVKNPFNPNYSVEVPGHIHASKIADFIVKFAEKVAEFVCPSLSTVKSPHMFLLHVVSSLVEPIWYSVVGSKYVPPADTRVPTHTIFDHLNATLTTLLWHLESQGGEPRGCLARIDLAGVQQWIRESRRLADLWASSWMASYLAWSTVKDLVDRLGPGVLVQPPSRLNPFYIASIVLPRITEKRREEASELLGLPTKWPVDPTVPSVLTIALPPSECEKIENVIASSYLRAWRRILSRTIKSAANLCQKQNAGCLLTSIYEHNPTILENLEPPLALRIHTADVEAALAEAGPLLSAVLEELEKEKRKETEKALSEGKEELAESRKRWYEIALKALREENISSLKLSLAYPMLLRRLRDEEGAIRISSPGRRSGPIYYRLAREIYKATRGEPSELKMCQVCGKAYAMIDGSSIDPARLTVEIRSIYLLIGGDRLCPYCLTKRLLKHLIVKEGLDEELVGVKIGETALKKLKWDTVDAFTSRTMAVKNHMPALVEKAQEAIFALANEALSSGKYVNLTAALLEAYNGLLGLLAPNRVLGRSERGEVKRVIKDRLHNAGLEDLDEQSVDMFLDFLEAFVLELLHDKAFLDEASNRLAERLGMDRNTIKKAFGELDNEIEAFRRRHHRRFALIQMDGDNMGKGILSGKLNLPSETYAEKMSNISEQEARKALIILLKKMAEKAGLVDGASTIVTPSYHASVSRALAAQSLIDRGHVEDLGGMIVYAGGDDLLAIVPASELQSNDGTMLRVPGLRLAMLARRSYWGKYNGFNIISSNGVDLQVVPALRAYGRTSVILFWDVKKPLWLALSHAASLESSKDHVLFRISGEEWCKDALVLASDSAGASVLPQSIPCDGDSVLLELPLSLEKLVNLTIPAGGRSAAISSGIVYDALEYTGILVQAALTLQSDKTVNHLGLLVESLFERNSPGDKRVLAMEFLEKTSGSLVRCAKYKPGHGLLIALHSFMHGPVAGLVNTTGLAGRGSDRAVIQPLLLGILGGLKIVRTAL